MNNLLNFFLVITITSKQDLQPKNCLILISLTHMERNLPTIIIGIAHWNSFRKTLKDLPVSECSRIEEELTCHFKMTWVIWRIATKALKNLKNLNFNGLLLHKVFNVWTKKVQKSFFSWHWRMMQYLKKNWLVVCKMPWVIWQNFTRALESL